MRILYVVPFVPWPVKVRSYNLIPRLARRHSIDLVCLARTPQERERIKALEPYCESIRAGTYSNAGAVLRGTLSLLTSKPLRIAWVGSESMRRHVLSAIDEDRPDVIYVERWRALQYVPLDRGIPVMCDPTDSMSLYNQRLMRSGKFWERPLGWVEHKKFRTFERRTATTVSATVFCSDNDIAALGPMPPGVRVVKVVNGVNVETFHAKSGGEEKEGTIFFSGNFKYSPNCKAASFFVDRVFPGVLASVPTARFLVVGNGATEYMRAAHPGARSVEVLDFVPDLQPYLASATVSVAPIVVGAGVSNKIMEAFSVGTSVVATPMACGDLPVRDGEHLLVASEAKQFTGCVVQLLYDHDLRRKMANAAQSIVYAQYDWEIVAGNMEQLLAETAGLPLLAAERASAAV
jgi:glycosyltransferase involved in cell wall biosynthesis